MELVLKFDEKKKEDLFSRQGQCRLARFIQLSRILLQDSIEIVEKSKQSHITHTIHHRVEVDGRVEMERNSSKVPSVIVKSKDILLKSEITKSLVQLIVEKTVSIVRRWIEVIIDLFMMRMNRIEVENNPINHIKIQLNLLVLKSNIKCSINVYFYND